MDFKVDLSFDFDLDLEGRALSCDGSEVLPHDRFASEPEVVAGVVSTRSVIAGVISGPVVDGEPRLGGEGDGELLVKISVAFILKCHRYICFKHSPIVHPAVDIE